MQADPPHVEHQHCNALDRGRAPLQEQKGNQENWYKRTYCEHLK